MNGNPWNQAIRSPGGGDNLFLSSIVALNPNTGKYLWHYQETPGETWDYTFASESGLRLRVVSAPANALEKDQSVWLRIDPSQIVRVEDTSTGA